MSVRATGGQHGSARLAAWLCLALALGAAAPGHALQGTVVRVSDGDSLWLRPAGGGRSIRVRLQGLDAPESCQAGGAESKRALEALVLNRTVQLDDRGHDDHGRTLGRLRLNVAGRELDVGARMVAQGQAWSYRYRGDAGPYQAEENRALRARLGLHARPGAVLPREFRVKHGPCP